MNPEYYKKHPANPKGNNGRPKTPPPPTDKPIPVVGPGDGLSPLQSDPEGASTAFRYPVLSDPMMDILPPGGPPDPIAEEEIPDEIKAIFEQYGLGKLKYRVILKRSEEQDASAGTISSNNAYVRSWSNSFPSVEWIAMNYGPGNYELLFSFRSGTLDSEGKRRNITEPVPISISDDCIEAHEEFIFNKKIKRIEERRKKVNNARLNKEFDVSFGLGDKDSRDAGFSKDMVSAVTEFSTLAKALGFDRGAGTNWKEILTLVIPAIPALIGYLGQQAEKRTAEQREFMTLLISTMSSSNNHLLDFAKVNAGVGGGSAMAKEYIDVLKSAIDIKKELNADREVTTADRIFSMLESVAPMIMQMAMMPKPALQRTPQYGMAKAMMDINPDLQKLKTDPAVLAEVISRWDAHFGWEQSDAILFVAQLERPEQCPRNSQQRYAAGDPRNSENINTPAVKEGALEVMNG